MAFDKPQSRNEAILQNMLGANNELEPPKSRVEALLQDIAGQMPEANPSEGTTTGTLERLKIGDDIYTVEGGGSGTSDYDALNNKPQIAGTTLSGDKSLADLGIASASVVSGILDGASIDSFADVETALAGKQDTLTFDDTPTDGSNNPVKSNGIYDALALKQDATDNSLETEAKTIVGAINEHEGDIGSLKSGFTSLDNEVNGDATVYPYADVITIEDAVPANLADCSVKIEPVQDLHGQSAPYVGGASKNKLPLVLATIKSLNTDGTWNDNVYTINNGTITVNTDDGGNVTSIKTNGTFNANTTFNLLSDIKDVLAVGTDIIINGCPLGGGATRYVITANNVGNDTGEGVSGQVPSIVSKVSILIYASYNVDNLLFKPMIRLATETDATFAPYTNICPISGHTEVDVTDEGKQLVPSGTDTSKGYKDNHYLTSNGVENSGGDTYISEYFDVVASSSYILKDRIGNANSASVCFYNANKQYISGYAVNKETKIITTPSNAVYARCTQIKNLIENEIYFKRANQYTIALGDTHYKGLLDVDTGVMTPTHTVVNMSTLSWTKIADGLYRAEQSGMKNTADNEVADMLCETYFPSMYMSLPYGSIALRYTNQIWVRDNTVADATELTTNLDGKKLCYPLGTPTTIQLTPQQIQLLKGTNTLTASTGQISVTVNGVAGSIGAVQEQVNELQSNVVRQCSLTPAQNVTIAGSSVSVNNQNVNLSMTATFDCTADTWVDLATITKKPTFGTVTAGINTANGEYLGMVNITTNGNIKLYPKKTLTNCSCAFSTAYCTND